MIEGLFGIILYFTIIGVMLVTIFPEIFRWLWNMTIPSIFNVREITRWEAFRIILMIAMVATLFR